MSLKQVKQNKFYVFLNTSLITTKNHLNLNHIVALFCRGKIIIIKSVRFEHLLEMPNDKIITQIHTKICSRKWGPEIIPHLEHEM